MNSRKTLCFARPAGIVVAVATLLTLVTLTSSAPARSLAVRTLHVSDTAHMHLAHLIGNDTLFEEGRATGTLAGTAHATLTLSPDGTTVTSSFTIYLHGSTLSGRSVGGVHNGRGGYASFAGTLTVTHGTGRYARAAGNGKLYGAINRYNDSATIQTIGTLRY